MIKHFINRTEELNWLEQSYQKAKHSGQFLIIYGKRRVGKTELITHFASQKNKDSNIYYLANETTKEEQLRSATQVFTSAFKDTFLSGSSFTSWREFFDYLIKKIRERKKEEPMIIIFDEFPYLAEASEGISSFFQYGWEMGLKDQKVLLILMGSSISMMYKHTLSKKAALYGRRTGQWLLEAFSFGQTKKFYPGAVFENAFSLFALSGGIPAYARVFDGSKTLKENIVEKILPEGEFLSVEPELLLAEEFDDPRSYLTILQAIGLGRTKFSQILQNSQLPATALPVYLQNLIELRLIKKEVPVTEPVPEKSKKGSYSLSDPFLRFYFSFIFPNKSLIKGGSYKALFTQHGEILTSLVAKAYEDASYEFITDAIKHRALPHFDKLGRWWDKDTEIDVVGINTQDNTILFAETKWSNKPIDVNVLTALKKKSEKVSFGKKDRKEYFVLISKGGFTDELIEIAKRKEVALIQQEMICCQP